MLLPLKDELSVYKDAIQATDGDYLILRTTNQPICPVCWGKEHKAIPVYGTDTGYFTCGCCGNVGAFDRRMVERIAADEGRAEQELFNTMNARSSDLRKYF